MLAPLAFLGAAAGGSRHPGSDPRPVQRAGVAAAWFGLAVAVCAGLAVAAWGPLTTATLGWEGLGLSLRLDALSTVMLVMISLLAVVIVRYSNAYLDGDQRHGTFLGHLALTIAAVELLVLSGNLVVLFLAWVGTSLALHQLLLFYRDRRGAVVAARKKFVAARVGDALLFAAMVLIWADLGTGDLGAIFAAMKAGGGGTGVELAAVALAAAAILKAAQFPTHGWLVEVMETPTPVSALLHAGILNAGPFLIIRMAFVMDGAGAANALLLVAGGLTAVFASVVLLTQPSVKVALGYSSAAHMGFMLMVCGLGVYPAALLHLVAHSFYKAHAFLSSGSVVDEERADKVPLPARLGSPWRMAASLGVALAFYLPLALVFSVDLSDPILLVIGGILVLGTTQLVAPALDSSGPLAGLVRTAALAFAVTLSFFTLETGAHLLVEDAVPGDTGRAALHLILALVVLVVFAAVIALQIASPGRPAAAWQRRWAVHFRNGLYANAAFDRLVGAWKAPAPTAVSR